MQQEGFRLIAGMMRQKNIMGLGFPCGDPKATATPSPRAGFEAGPGFDLAPKGAKADAMGAAKTFQTSLFGVSLRAQTVIAMNRQEGPVKLRQHPKQAKGVCASGRRTKKRLLHFERQTLQKGLELFLG
jgi:hypothetical protein